MSTQTHNSSRWQIAWKAPSGHFGIDIVESRKELEEVKDAYKKAHCHTSITKVKSEETVVRELQFPLKEVERTY